MREFAKTADEKIPAIQKAYEEQDWKKYAIHVHALKSTAMTIGAEVLSRKAAQLEDAGKKADGETIRTEHPRMMEMYETVLKALRKLPEEEKKEDPPEDGIFEFTPDSQ
jgi:HPt (histidine-containing phosphotransfer) domain-containing protein